MYKQIIGGVIGVVVLGLLWSSWVIVESGGSAWSGSSAP